MISLSRQKVVPFAADNKNLTRRVTTAYLAKLCVVLKRRFCPGDGDYKDGLGFESWEESVFSSVIQAKIRARLKTTQGLEVFVQEVPALALGSGSCTLLISDFEDDGRGIPELPMSASLREIGLTVMNSKRSTTRAWVAEPGFPVAELPFETTKISGKIITRSGKAGQGKSTRIVEDTRNLDCYVSILGKAILGLQSQIHS